MGSELITAPGLAPETAKTPGRAGRMPLGLLSGCVLVGVWLLVDPRTPDLAAQVYRVNLFGHAGALVFDERWYAGHPIPGYSLLFPALAWLVGIRVTAALVVLASCALFERIALSAYGTAGRWGAALFAIAATGDIWSGRLAFASGVSLALGAVWATLGKRHLLAGILALACAAFSPVAGALLGLAGLTHALRSRRIPTAAVLIAPVAILLGTTTLLFGEGGYEPYPVLSFAASTAVTVGFLCALPTGQRLLRIGGLAYLAVCLASLLLHTPMGSNIERYGVLLAAPLLACVLLGDRGALNGPRLLVLTGMLVWVIWGPVRETAAVAHNPSTHASYYTPALRFLETHGGRRTRVEVPLTRSHWEAALMAPHVSLARGWEKQLDERYDSVLLSGSLDSASYRRWLDNQAVGYVALPDVALDPSSAREGALIKGGLPYLREVFRSRHWRIFEVLDPTPLLSGPGLLVSLGHDSFTVRADRAGRFLVRIHDTRYWTITSGEGCVGPAAAGWTELATTVPGTVVVTAHFSITRALQNDSRSCRR